MKPFTSAQQDSKDADSGTSDAEQREFHYSMPHVRRHQLHQLPSGQHIILAPHQNPPVIKPPSPPTPTPAQVISEQIRLAFVN